MGRWSHETSATVVGLERFPFIMTKRTPIYDQPSNVRAVEGAVVMDGPDHVEVAMTPDAAEETSERLLGAVFEARGKHRLDHMPHRPKD